MMENEDLFMYIWQLVLGGIFLQISIGESEVAIFKQIGTIFIPQTKISVFIIFSMDQ